MGNIGRLVCVSVPFVLTVLSLIALLIPALAGVSNKSLYSFRVDLSGFSISPDSVTSLVTRRDIFDTLGGLGDDISNSLDNLPDNLSDYIKEKLGDGVGTAVDGAVSANGGSGQNITLGDIGLYEVYEISVWGYCSETANGTDRSCTKPKMNWANDMNATFLHELSDAFVDTFGEGSEIPDEVFDALDVFKRVSRWTQIVFIVALAALGLQVVIGLFSVCTRIASCLCFLIAGISSAATIAAASLATATSSVVVGVIESTESLAGAKGKINTTFLALVWISVAFALAAGATWLVTICCCAPDKSSRRSKHADGEKGFHSSSYIPLKDPNEPYHNGGARNSYYNSSHPTPNPRSDLAYEPYSHRSTSAHGALDTSYSGGHH
ncbi:uncharacterized protein DNG_04988 [Cephalotrichum gorgonifer]|uniref:SUR7 domain-containing protein n=1 Tax=Cephalotrichum gorgonifer TaxID=2041049 RepID=A0AAE8MXN7_9PEZI|nr:uncharacterized protein DNG_04988 [Cephalotrichum gorgonifer]